jgi:hypothetical protein
MMRSLFTVGAALLVLGPLVEAQQGRGQTPAPYPLSNAIRERGSSVTGAFEGWYYDKDGGQNLLVGYFNRNTKQELDIPIGPNNRIEPGDPDRGQPTHFLTSRQWGVFSIKVPKDFGAKELTWTLTVNGQTNTITLHTKADWILAPFEDPANKNTPPVIRFAAGAPAAFSGPPRGIAASYATSVGTALPLTVWATDEGPKINVPDPSVQRGGRARGGAAPPAPPALSIAWSLFRGPGGVTFDAAKPAIDRANAGKATTTATFAAPGEYILRVQANDATGDGGGGFQCCWTNAHVGVTVRGSTTTVY